jgi:hypothetical protein
MSETTTAIQITFDAADPHAQARFWAEALGYAKEDHTAIVQGLLDAGHLPAEAAIEVDGGTGFVEVAACSDHAAGRPRLLFQRVPESKTVKNRVHLDLHVGRERADAEAERLQALGATHAWTTDDRGSYTITLRDPEGNEFCVE